MSTLKDSQVVQRSAEPRRRQWTAAEFYQIAELGLFEGERLELIDGEILEMSPHGARHTASIHLVAKRLESIYGKAYWVRIQSPLVVSSLSAPEPDLAVVKGSPRDYVTSHPSTALLVVEVSDTTLASDRARKANLYASAQVPEYWIVNLIDRQLEVFRQPVADLQSPFGSRYQSHAEYAADGRLHPLAHPDATIEVRDLLP